MLLAACLVAAATFAGEPPLSKDDVTLLLLGGATQEKMIALIQQRGVDFQMNPDLAKKFHDDGASDNLIDALQKAGEKASTQNASANPAGSKQPATSSAAPATVSSGHASVSAGDATGSSHSAPPSEARSGPSVDEKVHQVMQELESRPAEASEPATSHPTAPGFLLKDIFGQRLSLGDYKGRVVLLDFWATWCGPCRSEIPRFVELKEQYRDQGLAIVGIALDDSIGAVKQFYSQYRMNYPVAMGDRAVRAAYGPIVGLPTTFLIGRDGRIHTKVPGAVDVDYIEGQIKTLLAAQDSKPMGALSTAETAKAGSDRQAPPASSVAQSAAPAILTISTPVAASAASAAKPAGKSDLSDPSPEQSQKIIQAFAAKEELFKEARNNYTYHQINKVQTLDADGSVDGQYQQDWDILYDDSGKRIERVTYAPPDTLKRIQITAQDLDAFRNIQPFVLTTEEVPEYDIKYMGHVKVDEVPAYVFSIRPKELKKGRQYFQGVVWVDDRDLQIVKSEGKNVPELKTKGGENLFPRFTTYREQIDGKFWFPTYTEANDTLHFSAGPVRIREVVKYTNYKQFKSTTKIKVLSEVPSDQNKTSAQSPPKK